MAKEGSDGKNSRRDCWRSRSPVFEKEDVHAGEMETRQSMAVGVFPGAGAEAMEEPACAADAERAEWPRGAVDWPEA